MKFRPTGKHLLIEEVVEEGEADALAAFDAFIEDKEVTSIYKVVDCPHELSYWRDKLVLVEMVRPHTVKGETFYTCLEHNIVGVYEDDSKD